ncbi:TonB-dependent receptor [Derxia gummosa]|uniref:TonB-dependent receptor n=1 Tax=Derxia gummosa DSM 723 TaxID=1121388 RepID=A0A9U5D0E4_9BURK|nr:TonB-dependent siderophore receptor [Derxia gummosa]
MTPLFRPSAQPRAVLTSIALAARVVSASVVAGAALGAAPAMAQAATSDANAPVLPAVKVAARKESATDLPAAQAGGQVARGARVGLLGNLDVMDTPFNLTAYTAELIENQQARTLAEVFANDPSVRFTTSSGHAYENFRVRGFDVNAGDLAIDGLFGLAPVGHVPTEMFERVELLKGASALFTGMPPGGGVGGVVNLVPKRAGSEPLTRVTVGYQSEGQVGTSVDVGRRFGPDDSLGLRLNGAYSDGETSVDGQSKKRKFASAAFDYRNRDLVASLDAYYSKESFKGGTPAMYWFSTTTIPKAPKGSANQFPNAWGDLESKAAIARASYDFTPALSAFAAVGVMQHDYAGMINGTHARQIQANGNYTGRMVAQLGYTDSLSAEAGLRASVSTGAVAHEFVLQGSRLGQENGSGSNLSTYSSNIYDPVVWAMPALPLSSPKTSEVTLSSLALVDTMSMLSDRLRLIVGLRHQRVETTNYSSTTGLAVQPVYDKSALTPSVAVVVRPWAADVSLYANYVQGLSKGDSVTTVTPALIFAPYKTEQEEVGVKWNAAGFGNTASLFQITRPTLISHGSGGDISYSDGGEKRVRGLEWNTFGEVMPGLRLLGGATYTQGIQTRTTDDLYNGKAAVGAPRWQGNLGTEWDAPWLAGLTLTGRVTATSSQYLDSANTQRIAGWGVLDAGARYATRIDGRRVVLRLNVNNLSNRAYYSGSFSDSTPIATLGAARSVMTSASVDF